MALKIRAVGIFLTLVLLLGCDQQVDVITCSGSTTEGSVWLNISSENEVLIGDLPFSEQLLREKRSLVKKTCDSVVVIIVFEKGASHKVVGDLIQRLVALGYKIGSM